MAHDAGRPLPKFGEWDVNDPASAEGFTVIFTKARENKKSNAKSKGIRQSSQKNQNTSKASEKYYQHPPMGKRWFCCFF